MKYVWSLPVREYVWKTLFASQSSSFSLGHNFPGTDMYKTARIHPENCLVRVFAVWGVVLISTFWLHLDISTTLHTAAAHVGFFPPTHENADLTMATEVPPAMSHDAPTKVILSPRESKRKRLSNESEEAIGVVNGEETTPEI